MDIKLMEDLVKLTVTPLMLSLNEELKKYFKEIEFVNDPHRGYIYCKGILPILLVGHLDTVHKEPVVAIKRSKANHLSSPQGIGGDDRAGIYLIISLLRKGFKPSVLFTTGEEVGGHGARAFVESHKHIDNVNWMLEFDRAGYDDVVKYSDDNDELINQVMKFGFKKAIGSFTDISILAPHFGVSAVNVSAGYYNPHRTSEYIDLYEVDVIEGKVATILRSTVIKNRYEYKHSPYSKYSFNATTPAKDKFESKFSGGSEWYGNPLYKTAKKSYTDGLIGQCSMCGKQGEVVDTYNGYMCKECAKDEVHTHRGVACSVCGSITEVTKADRERNHVECMVCGATIELWNN